MASIFPLLRHFAGSLPILVGMFSVSWQSTLQTKCEVSASRYPKQKIHPKDYLVRVGVCREPCGLQGILATDTTTTASFLRSLDACHKDVHNRRFIV